MTDVPVSFYFKPPEPLNACVPSKTQPTTAQGRLGQGRVVTSIVSSEVTFKNLLSFLSSKNIVWLLNTCKALPRVETLDWQGLCPEKVSDKQVMMLLQGVKKKSLITTDREFFQRKIAQLHLSDSAIRAAWQLLRDLHAIPSEPWISWWKAEYYPSGDFKRYHQRTCMTFLQDGRVVTAFNNDSVFVFSRNGKHQGHIIKYGFDHDLTGLHLRLHTEVTDCFALSTGTILAVATGYIYRGIPITLVCEFEQNDRCYFFRERFDNPCIRCFPSGRLIVGYSNGSVDVLRNENDSDRYDQRSVLCTFKDPQINSVANIRVLTDDSLTIFGTNGQQCYWRVPIDILERQPQ